MYYYGDVIQSDGLKAYILFRVALERKNKYQDYFKDVKSDLSKIQIEENQYFDEGRYLDKTICLKIIQIVFK